MRPHEKLDVWKRSILLTEKVYGMCNKYPKDEIYGLVSQMRRAAVSVCCNVAEAAARQTKVEFRQFLYMARGSLSELETQAVISRRLGYIKADEVALFMQETEVIGKMITALIKTLI